MLFQKKGFPEAMYLASANIALRYVFLEYICRSTEMVLLLSRKRRG